MLVLGAIRPFTEQTSGLCLPKQPAQDFPPAVDHQEVACGRHSADGGVGEHLSEMIGSRRWDQAIVRPVPESDLGGRPTERNFPGPRSKDEILERTTRPC